MDDIIYEKDYRSRPQDEADERSSRIFDQAVNGGFFASFQAEMDKIPKVIVPEDKANYEDLLDKCDQFVKRYRGQIRGVVDYHHWHSEIVMTLAFAEFCDPEDLAFLREITEKSHSVTFEPTENGGIRVRIFICYFEELMTAEHKGYLRYYAITEDEKLSDMLGMPSLPPEMNEAAQRMKEILDAFEEETEYDRTTIFKALLERMSKVEKEDQTLDMMVAFAERLLEMVLNEENNPDTEE